jgi:hypothetical protein
MIVDASAVDAPFPADAERARRTWLPVTTILALGAFAVVALEAARVKTDSRWAVWLAAECVVAAAALFVAWRRQEQIRLLPLLAVAIGFHALLVLLHLRLGVPGDHDVTVVYPRDGNPLLDGDYPASAYPPGAVSLLGLEVLLGDGTARTPNAFLMIPFNALLVSSVWTLRTETSAWLAALAALAPAQAWFWEFRFDLVPAALLAVGLALAWRDRWLLAAVLLGVGTWVKWSPALAAVGLVSWLVGTGSQRRLGLRFAAVFLATVVVLHAPFLVWSGDEVLESLTGQGGRGITAESLPFLPLRALGLAEVSESGFVWEEATRPNWADGAALAAQGLVLVLAIVVGTTARSRAAGFAVAALLPALFLLSNRIFSPQFGLVIAVGWLVAGALLCRTRRRQLALGAATMAALAANMLVYPIEVERWLAASAVFFAVVLAVTGALLGAAAMSGRRTRVGSTTP